MKNNVGINLPKDQVPLPDNTPIPGPAATPSHPPRMSSKDRGEFVTDANGRRFRNGIEYFYEDEFYSDNQPSDAEQSLSSTDNTSKTPVSASAGLFDRYDDSALRQLVELHKRMKEAALAADCNLLTKLTLERTELVKQVEQQYSSLLLEAITQNLPGIAERLIASGASPHYQNSDGETALMLAADKGYLSLVDKLIQNEALINQQQNRGWTALMLAAGGGHQEVAELLIRNGASVHLTSQHHSALTAAAENGHLNVTALLISKGLPVNSRPDKGCSALMRAAQKNHVELAEFLISKGANVNTERNGWTALMLAAKNNQLEMARLLIREGANVNKLRQDGWTALILAAVMGHSEIAALLIHNGADICAVADGSKSPLNAAVINQRTEIIDLLLPILIRKHYKNPKLDCRAELKIAVEKGYTNSLSALLKNGIKIEPKTDLFIWRYIFSAVKNGHTEVVQKLMDEFSPSLPLSTSWFTGVDEKVFQHLQESLNEAVKNGNHEIARLMIKAGAKTDQVDKKGRKLLQIAIEKGHAKTIQLLLEHQPAPVQEKLKKKFHELIIALNLPSPDSMVVDILLEHQFQAALKEGSFSYQQKFDDLSDYIHTEFMTDLEAQRNTDPEQRLMGYLCAELGFRHMIANAVITSVRNSLQIYSSVNQKDGTPTVAQLKIAFAENLASSQILNDLMRDDNPAPETIYANHEQAPEQARALARTTILQASLLLLTATEESQKQQAALSDFVETMKPATPALQIRKFMQEAGWHPLLVDLLSESWDGLQQNKTLDGLLLAVRNRLDTVEFAEKTESLPSDPSRHLLTRQAERLSEMIKKLS